MKSKENTSIHPASAGLALRSVAVAGLFVANLVLGQAAYAQLTLGGAPEDVVFNSVEDAVQEQAEEAVLDAIEEEVEERVLVLGGTAIEQKVEESVEEQVADQVEEAIDEAIADNAEITIEGNIEDDIEQDVDETIEAIVEESVEESVEDRVEESVADNVAATVEESLEESVEEELTANVEQSLEQGVEDNLEGAVEVAATASVEDRIEDGIDDILERIEIDEGRINKDQWLVMAEPEVFEELAKEGYLFETVTELPGLGLRLAEVAAPSSFDITEVRQGVIDVLGSDRAEVDLNHIYTAGDQVSTTSEGGTMPRAAVIFPADTDQMPLRIGMIDSLVDTGHPAFNGSQIESRSFAHNGAVLPSFHGTAIASIIAANNGGEYVGLAPHAQIFAAAVFEQDPQRGEIASTVSLVRALDWLITSGVDVVNISLAGPPNRLLEAALAQAAANNVLILAAAGNGGPAAEPMYPAAYSSVVAVTAVDAKGQVFRLANRGDYLDLAAPGVSMRHALSGGGYAASSGTSFAVPFAATAAARLRQLHPGENALEALYQTAQDLGPPGRDNIYGYGLLRPVSS